jgi:hypothetical protein
MLEEKILMIERLTDEMEVTGGNLFGTTDMYRLSLPETDGLADYSQRALAIDVLNGVSNMLLDFITLLTQPRHLHINRFYLQ